jgi:chromosome segregation ATPase
MQDTIKHFKRKIDKAPNLKEISHRCFLYFAELYYMVAFVLADTSEVATLKVLLSKQFAKVIFQLEDNENKVDELTNSLHTTSKSRDFLFERCENLENKFNNLSVSMADCSHEKKSLETANCKLKEDLQATEKRVLELVAIVKSMAEDKVEYQDAKETLEGMSLVLADIYTAVSEVEFPLSPQSELFSEASN